VFPIISLREVIDSNRLKAIAQKGSQILNVTPDDFIHAMDRDFINAFSSGYYGNQIMIAAAECYIRDIEKELF
jgi:hypothetical protein